MDLRSLSRNFIDLNKPLVNHAIFVCLYLLYFTSLPDICLFLACSTISCIFW